MRVKYNAATNRVRQTDTLRSISKTFNLIFGESRVFHEFNVNFSFRKKCRESILFIAFSLKHSIVNISIIASRIKISKHKIDLKN